MRFLAAILFSVLLPAGVAHAADLTGMTCVQSEAAVLRFGSNRAETDRAAQEFRIEMNRLHARDANGQEQQYPLVQVQSSRYTAGNRTIIFNPDYTAADVAYVTMTDVQVSRWRCQTQK
ncbi:MAG: hypothetical protein HYS17_07020 [Micavibrio aeruginosavorus]|uniref:Uncharacterized protein n=1 Tax=Micavibrio aeruginosavorus TaxID=349221 RepID=A0A7T5R0J4_9BACT|nr:MAG: hypothetical protein HYS17_07020 [Micavibrio aeruginosavorus]